MKSLRRQNGFTLIAAMFILVITSLALSVAINVLAVQRTTVNFSTGGARAYHAARSGIEWGIARIAENPGSCWAPTPQTMMIGRFNVSIDCTQSTYQENGTLELYEITSVAEYGSYLVGGAPNPDYVRRRVRAIVSP